MSELHLYVAETDHPRETKADIVVKNEIAQEELKLFHNAIGFGSTIDFIPILG